MAVYTPLTHDEIATHLALYDIGTLESAQGIMQGVENTNYLITTDRAKYILTLFEKRAKLEDLPYFLHLTEWMHARGIQCPQPIHSRDGRMLHALKEKPAVVISFMEGHAIENIKLEHMRPLGDLLARIHIAGMDFPHRRANELSVDGWAALAEKIGGRADEIAPGLAYTLQDECHYLAEQWPQNLPGGAVHADLFPDNVFWVRERGSFKISGVIDWYFACQDSWAYDLAVVINAWCFDARHKLVPERLAALMEAYSDVRLMEPHEEAAMPLLLRGAALRFLLTRTHDTLFHPPGAQVKIKDPLEYLTKLEFFQNGKWQ